MAQFFHLGGGVGMAQNHFSVLIPFLKIQFKNPSNLILLGFKMSSESFFSQEFQNRAYFLTYRGFLPNANFITANFITAVFQNYY